MTKLSGKLFQVLSRCSPVPPGSRGEPGKLPGSGARLPGCAGGRRRWLETGSGKIPGLSWPRPAHVETERRRSRRKELLGKARGQRNCRACTRRGGSLGGPRLARGQAQGIVGRLSLSWDQSPQSPAHLGEKSTCKSGIHGPSVRGQTHVLIGM